MKFFKTAEISWCICVSVKFAASVSSVHSQPVYVNAHQASLPNLNLIDPPYSSGVSIQEVK